MQTIKIRRPKEIFNENIKYKILVDGVIVGQMKNGEEKTLTISENVKTLTAEMHSKKGIKLILKTSPRIKQSKFMEMNS